jgi:hypothetical protein
MASRLYHTRLPLYRAVEQALTRLSVAPVGTPTWAAEEPASRSPPSKKLQHEAAQAGFVRVARPFTGRVPARRNSAPTLTLF